MTESKAHTALMELAAGISARAKRFEAIEIETLAEGDAARALLVGSIAEGLNLAAEMALIAAKYA